ncbi:hypothetical protein LXL04_038382 [Taraxacum kok-saghyz]
MFCFQSNNRTITFDNYESTSPKSVSRLSTPKQVFIKPSPDGPMGKTLASLRGGQGFESRRVSIRGGHGLVFGSGFIDSAYYNGQRPGHPGEPVLNGNTL